MYVKHGCEIMPIIWGEQGLIGGTENVIGIAALATAIDELDYDTKELCEKRDLLMQGLQQNGGQIIGAIENRLPNNVCVYLNQNDGEYIVVVLNELGICASSGSACSSGNGEPYQAYIDVVIEEVKEVNDEVNNINEEKGEN